MYTAVPPDWVTPRLFGSREQARGLLALQSSLHHLPLPAVHTRSTNRPNGAPICFEDSPVCGEWLRVMGEAVRTHCIIGHCRRSWGGSEGSSGRRLRRFHRRTSSNARVVVMLTFSRRSSRFNSPSCLRATRAKSRCARRRAPVCVARRCSCLCQRTTAHGGRTNTARTSLSSAFIAGLFVLTTVRSVADTLREIFNLQASDFIELPDDGTIEGPGFVVPAFN